MLVANSATGHKKLLELLAEPCPCKFKSSVKRPAATNIRVVAVLQAAKLPVSVLNPGHVRHYALSQGGRAKSDPLDCALLTAYGQAHQPAPALKPNPALLPCAPWWTGGLLKEQLVRARQHGEHTTDAFLLQRTGQARANIWPPASRRWKNNWPIWSPPRSDQQGTESPLLDEMPGVGFITAITVLCHMLASWASSIARASRGARRGWRPGSAKAGRGTASGISAAAGRSCATPST